MPAGKGKKLSKAEKDKLKKEEQERKEAEEEEERARALEEEKRRKKEEKLLEAERHKLENEERKRRRVDMMELAEVLNAVKNNLQAKDDERRKQAKWARFMRCDGSPDPTIQGEINTYINLKLENRDREDADSVLKDSQLDLALISEVEFLLSDAPLDDLPKVERQRYRETIGELQHLIQLKLDKATLQVLCDASKLQDPETNNLQFVLKNGGITLCVWGNLSKNPRIKQFEFTETGFGFDIPKALTLSSCAMRFLHTKFDHFSPYSKAFYPRRKKKEEEEVPVPEAPPVEDLPPPAEGEGTQDRGDGEEVPPAVEEKEDTMDLLAALRGETVEKEEEKEEEEQEPEDEEDYPDPPTPDLPEWEDFDEEDDVVDLRAYQVVGGVFCFDLLGLPPQPRNCNNWVITQLVDPPKIEFLEYIADPPIPAGQEKGKEKEGDKRDEKPPINVTLNLRPDVMFLEEPQIARWDANKQYWRTDGFSNLSFDEENRTFKFSVSHFGTMCLLQDTHINMPFQSWELRPHKANSAVLMIIAAIVELEIEIKDGLCCLSQPSEKKELAHLINKWVTPKELIQNMQRTGLNVFPQEDSSKFVTVQNKHPLVTDRLYEQMGLVASAVAFSWSKWNSSVEYENVVMQATEALQDEPLLEDDWSIFLASTRRFAKLKMKEFDEEFSQEMASDITFKSNLYHFMQANASEAAKERIQESSNEFIDCVTQLLRATQVLTYA